MSPPCQECNASTIWDEDIGSAICTSCGTLVDPSQSVLTSAFGPLAFNHREQLDSLLFSHRTLKRYRVGNGWDLPGQGKEARDRKNNHVIIGFIKSLTASLGSSGLSTRASALFNQAMAAGRYRWGRRAKLVAGACVAISLREARKPESVCAIAQVLGEATHELYASIMAVISLLKLSPPLATPSTYVPEIQSHVMTLLQSEPQQDSAIPRTVISQLRPLSFHAVANTTYALLDTLGRLAPSVTSSAVPTACAAFMLSIEAEARSTLSNLEPLAQSLCSPYSVGKATVMSRYKLLQDSIASWIERVPWLEQYRPKNGRAKISKRLVVIRGLKDVTQFHAEILEDTLRTFSLDPGGNDDADEQMHGIRGNSDDKLALVGSDGMCTPDACEEGWGEQQIRKRRRVNQDYKNAAHFLLDPLTARLPWLERPEQHDTWNATSEKQIAAASPMVLSILTQAPGDTRPLTRLQRLVVERGGGAESVADDELFAPGELECLLRNEEEIEQLREILGWGSNMAGSGHEHHIETGEPLPPPPKSKPRSNSIQKTRRINMEAFAKLMSCRNSNENGNDSGSDDEVRDVDQDQDDPISHDRLDSDTGTEARNITDNEFQRWRRSRYGQYDSDGDDRYDQELD